MQELTTLVLKVAPHDCSVLVHGESGTGKELIARSIQENSKRAKGPFVPLNCGAMPDALTESILFGHEKGSFTGASSDKRGLFEAANGGTIFLDEIGEMPEVACEELAHLMRTEAPATQVKWAARTAQEFAVALEKTLATRKEMGKDKPPHVVYTTEEWKQLKEYAKTRDLAVKDDRAAARLQSTRVVAGAEQKEALAKVDAFQSRRHFWKFHVEGFGKISLREIEQKIKTETEDKFKLYNFLRPTKREAIQLRIEFLQETKRDIQKEIASAERPARSNLPASQLKYETASKLVEYAEKARAQQGREMPLPSLKDPSWPK